jgi:hypothetical protein
MLILHDSPSGDLSHIQAIGDINEGFALFDYVKVEQAEPQASWIGQIVEPNQNISVVGSRLDPTIIHGLRLMQTNSNVQAVQSAQVFDILILGQHRDGQLLTPRLRPLPGSKVTRLDARETAAVIEIPQVEDHEDGATNAVGELLNAEDVPLCVDRRKFNYHIMVAGGTGSGKSNVAANLVDQGVKYGMCVLIHDAKPDYRIISLANTDARVGKVWECFEQYKLSPHGAADVTRVGFYGKCDPDSVDVVLGFRCSDFHPEMLASLFFTGAGPAEQNGHEGFAGAASALYRQMQGDEGQHYDLNQILGEVRRRFTQPGLPPEEAIHELTARNILRKVALRRNAFPWLDAVGQALRPAPSNRLRGSRLDGHRTVSTCDLGSLIAKGRILLIDYSQMDDQSYAVLLSYFLRECQRYRKGRGKGDAARPGVVQLVDEAHRIFDNDSRHSGSLAVAFERVMREGRSVDHSIILSLQNTSQIPHRVMNNLNTKFVMRQNSKAEAEAATETMGKEFGAQAMRLGTGHALVLLHEARATVLAQMAPSPYELMRTDNVGATAPGSGAEKPPAAGRAAPAYARWRDQGSEPTDQHPDPSARADDDDVPF